MPAEFNKGATLIALKEVRVASRTHLPGDHFAWRRYALAERRVAQLLDQRQIAELTQESFDIAMARRSAEQGVVPHGFTRDGLKAAGIEVPDDPEAEAVQETDLAFEDYDHTEQRGDFLVAMRKAGIAETFDVFDAEHRRLNTARIRGARQLDAYLFSLEADRARNLPPAEAPGHDGQSEPHQADPVAGEAGQDAVSGGEGDYE